jgi:hypothetical protein
MTPLITQMVRLSPEPETATWFDVGSITHAGAAHTPVEDVMRLPYDRTAIVGIDKDGTKFALWLLAGDGSVTVSGCTASGKYFTPFAYMQTPDGLRYYRGDAEVDKAEVNSQFRMVVACLSRINDCTECYQPTIRLDSLTNQRRAAKGKPPLVYTWHTVKLVPNAPPAEPQGGTHASPRRHQCRGHWRNCKSGKRVWVKDCWKGDASKGLVFKDYKA